jgi:hypothetical protein
MFYISVWRPFHMAALPSLVGSLDIEIVSGRYYSLRLRLDAAGIPMNLTGYVVHASIRSGTVTHALQVTPDPHAPGVVLIEVLEAISVLIRAPGILDLWWTDPLGHSIPLSRGRVQVNV